MVCLLDITWEGAAIQDDHFAHDFDFVNVEHGYDIVMALKSLQADTIL